MKHIPNIISILRMALSIVLIFLPILSVPFYIVYVLSGFSDVLDGFLARKLKCVSKLGDMLDRYADIALFIVLLFKLALAINWEQWVIISLLVIAVIRLIVLLTPLLKFKKIRLVKSYFNRASEFSVFLFPVFYLILGAGITVGIVLSVAALAGIDELAIIVSSKKFNEEKRSAFPFK